MAILGHPRELSSALDAELGVISGDRQGKRLANGIEQLS